MKFKLTLNVKIMLAIFLTIFVVGGVSIFEIKKFEYNFKKDRLNDFNLFSHALQEGIEAQFFERYGDVQAFAINSTIKNGSKSQVEKVLNDYIKLYVIYDLILYADAKGNIKAVNTESANGQRLASDVLLGKNVAKEEWFRRALAGEYTEDKSKGIVGAYVHNLEKDSYSSQVYGKELYSITFSTQVVDEKGEVIGVLINKSNPIWINGILEETVHNFSEEGFKTTKVSLLSGNLEKLIQSRTDGDKVITENNVSFEKNDDLKELFKEEHTKGYVDEKFFISLKLNEKKMVESIGWRVLIEGDSAEVLSSINMAIFQMIVAIFVVSIICLALGFFFSKKISTQLMDIVQSLRKGSEIVSASGNEVKRSSHDLSSATTEQASAIEETVSSMEEMGSMLAQTTQQTQQGLVIVQEGLNEAQQGKAVINDLMNAMEQIDQSNDKLSKLIGLIQDIQSKTNIINDIVFETRLLSFNASIEAARASVHGKGFAVVAEEIGKLATMSGKAAEEINELLDSSTKEVNYIVNDIQEKVKRGKLVSQDCESAFTVIDSTFDKINESVKLIAAAAKEQELGIKQTNTAMGEMEQVTQKNSKAAETLAAQSGPLAETSVAIFSSVSTLNSIVFGDEDTAEKSSQVSKSGGGSEGGGQMKDQTENKVRKLTRNTQGWKNNSA